jgi:hypothetical protein
MIKQAHEVARYNYKPENAHVKAFMLDRSKSIEFITNVERGSRWQRAIVPCIYPTITDRFGVWQALKQGLGFKGGFQMDDWILKLHGQEKFVQMVKSDLNLFVSKLDDKYKHPIEKGQFDGFARFYKYWRIGHESNFMPKLLNDININSVIETVT